MGENLICEYVALQIHRADYINGGTALHLAALNGHSRCICLLVADYVPSIPNICSVLRNTEHNESISEFNQGYLITNSPCNFGAYYLVLQLSKIFLYIVSVSALHEVINRGADGGVTALHMAALNGHIEAVHLLLNLGASVSSVTVGDGNMIDLIGKVDSIAFCICVYLYMLA